MCTIQTVQKINSTSKRVASEINHSQTNVSTAITISEKLKL